MGFFQTVSSWFERSAPRRRRKTLKASTLGAFFETSGLVAVLIFVVTAMAMVLISIVGVNTTSLPVQPNQLAAVRIVSSAAFSYESQLRTQELAQQLRDRTPPVYRLENAPLRQFEKHTDELLTALATIPPITELTPLSDADKAKVAELTTAFNTSGPYRARLGDVVELLTLLDPTQRAAAMTSALSTLRELYAQGIHDSTLNLTQGDDPNMAMFRVTRAGEMTVSERPVESMTQALNYLRVNLLAEGLPQPVAMAIFRIARNGLTPNLVYDAEATAAQQKAAVANLRPVVVQVTRGETMIEPGTRVTNEQYEMLTEHRKFLLRSGGQALEHGLELFGRILLVLAMLLASVFYIRLQDRTMIQSNSSLGLLALVVILNIGVIRLTYAIGSLPYFIGRPELASLLPFIAPTVLAPLIVAILIDGSAGIFMALLISVFTSVIYGNRLDVLVINFLASTIAVFGVRAIRNRANVVRAAGLSGVTVAIFTLLIGISDQLPVLTVVAQMAAGLANGFVTGVVVVGVLPLLEGLFKRTTDITLLELTDYNHPLLRLMQLEAPGSYHHSLVVAQLSENAASTIGANPLRARVCALFHDIGKSAKPEYFTENQRDGVNPHDNNNPSLSALIIKSHVKDGVDLALKHKLPRAVIDVIREHHGTSLIRYFFHRAVSGAAKGHNDTRSPFTPSPKDPTLPGIDPVPVSESTYRYDGPLPRSKESAIIHLADSVEAASRSLAKITPQSLDELIEAIFSDRIKDGQLDLARLTFAELTKVKDSFAHTLLTMLHTRIAYPAGEKPDTPKAKPISTAAPAR